ncbi:MAG: fibronectin type III domain-containing protein, partial [Pseudoclavibacter sp.]
MTLMRRSRAAVLTTAFLACTATAIASPLAAATASAVDAPDTPISHLGLQPGANASQLNLNWFTASGGAEAVQIGQATADGVFPADAATFGATLTTSQDREGLQFASATASGLEPNTAYVYRVGSDEGGWSEAHEYTTRGDGDFNFLFYGDPQLGSGGSSDLGEGQGLEADAQGWYDTLEVSTETYPDASFLFSSGDQIDGYGDEGELEAFLGDRDPQYDAFFADQTIRSYPIAVLPGNHDDNGYTYDEFWNMPNDEDRNSWFEHNGALFVNLDANMISIETYMALARAETEEDRQAILASVQPDIEAKIAEMKTYLTDVVEAQGAEADWVIAAFHQSPYSQATHYVEPDV